MVRGREKRSESQATGTSSKERMAPVEAMADRMKKSVAKKVPPGMEAKTAGMVRKSRAGPSAGWKPKLNTAGKMAMPASRETSRSQIMTRVAMSGILTSSLK